HLLLQHDQEMRGVCIEGQEIQELGLPWNQARQCPVGPHPDAERPVRVEARQRLEQIRLIVEEAVLQVDRERQRMQHQSAGRREIVDHLECVVLIEQVFGGPVIGGQSEFSSVFRRYRIEIDVEGERAEIPVYVDAFVPETQAFMQMARGRQAGSRVVDVPAQFVSRRYGTAERLEQAGQQSSIRAPNALRAQLDHAVDAVEGADDLELAIEREDGGTEAHCEHLR